MGYIYFTVLTYLQQYVIGRQSGGVLEDIQRAHPKVHLRDRWTLGLVKTHSSNISKKMKIYYGHILNKS